MRATDPAEADMAAYAGLKRQLLGALTGLCSVADPGRVLTEVQRVLRPGGTFVFFEHVASAPGAWSWHLQRTGPGRTGPAQACGAASSSVASSAVSGLAK